MSNFNEQIKRCETLKQVFEVINEHYDTNQNLGIVTGNTVKNQIPELVKLLKLKPKK